MKYVRYDDVMRKKMEDIKAIKDEIKELTESRKPSEDYIVKFLEENDAPFVKVKSGKLVRVKTESKGTYKPEIIRESIVEGIQEEEEIKPDEVQSNDIANKIMDIMDGKRVKTTKFSLRRVVSKQDGDSESTRTGKTVGTNKTGKTNKTVGTNKTGKTGKTGNVGVSKANLDALKEENVNVDSNAKPDK